MEHLGNGVVTWGTPITQETSMLVDDSMGLYPSYRISLGIIIYDNICKCNMVTWLPRVYGKYMVLWMVAKSCTTLDD